MSRDEVIASWSEAKRLSCCKKEHVACTGLSTTTQPLFDCDEGYLNWKNWPAPKKDWCCKHQRRGCTGLRPAPHAIANGCQLVCQGTSCEDRIQDAAKTEYANQPEACFKAFQQVLAHCSVCSKCTPQETQCVPLPI